MRFPLPAYFATLFVSMSALFVTAGPSVAQTPGPFIPVDAKGFRAAMIRSQYLQDQSAQRAHAADARAHSLMHVLPVTVAHPVATNLLVTVAYPTPKPKDASINVALRGPDGKVRSFPVEGGLQSIYVQKAVVHPGESLTIRINPGPARP